MSGVGASQAASAFTAAGAATASSTGAASSAATFSAAGAATASAVGVASAGGSVGSAAGVATASAVGASTAEAVGTASGVATAAAVAATSPSAAAGDYGGTSRKRKKKRVIPLYEDTQTSGDARGSQPLPEQAGERAPPPATLPADQLSALRAWEAFKPVEYRVPTWTDDTDWKALSEAFERQERKRQALEAKRAAERRAAEAWLIGAVTDVARDFVDENASKAEEAFARYHEARRKREQDEERFLILAAMELFR